MDKKISVIVPTLNSINYIEPCLSSIINQTFRELEIIIVDAGSTDGTKEYLDELSAQDERIVLLHSEKKSYGYQLNLGIGYATGNYIGVVESDDIIELDMYEALYNVAITDNFDYVKGIGRFFWDNANGNSFYSEIGVFSKDRYKNDKIVIDNHEECLELLRKDYYLWTGLYRCDFIKNIKFNETSGAAFQDVGFLAQAYYSCKKACYINKYIYNYRQTNLTSSSVNRKGFRYILDENEYLAQKKLWQDKLWRKECLFKAFRQASRRLQVMAIQGEFWDEKRDEINEVRKIILDAESDLKLSDLLTEWEKEKYALFIEEPHKLYEKYKVEADEWKNKKDRFTEDISGRNWIVFGCGEWGSFAGFLVDSSLSAVLVGFADNSSTLWNTEMYSKSVMRPEYWTDKGKDYYYLIANKRHGNEIKEQLNFLGVDNNRIVLYEMGKNMMLI